LTKSGPNFNRRWAGLIIDELVRCGVTQFFIAPGSRSTPLVVAITENPDARSTIHFDERGAAFMALGYGRATGAAAAWITTSGTAVANGLPAVIEAATDGVPLILLTADRPPELRETGANQTIDQVKIFGGYPAWFADLPTPDALIDPSFIRSTVDQAVYRTRRAPGGVVHLNCMFREPLVAEAHDTGEAALEGSNLRSHGPLTTYGEASAHFDTESTGYLRKAIGAPRGVIIAGKLKGPAEGTAARALAERLGWPLFADIGSFCRLGCDSPAIIPYFDRVLASGSFRCQPPQTVIHLGGRCVSKHLLQYLDEVRPDDFIVVRDDPKRFDPTHQATLRIEADVVSFCTNSIRALDDSTLRPHSSPAFLSAWKEASRLTEMVLTGWESTQKELSEPLIARLLSQNIAPGSALVLANSMPVRDMDMFADSNGAKVFTAMNRGASGIDGTIATAAGVAIGTKMPVALLIGDLAMLHDLNSLAALSHLETPVVLVVVNNDGGGIFHFLPIAKHEEVFEPAFTAPHGLSFEQAARMFGLPYTCPRDPAAFVAAFREGLSGSSSMIIEIRTDRDANATLHRELTRLVSAALE